MSVVQFLCESGKKLDNEKEGNIVQHEARILFSILRPCFCKCCRHVCYGSPLSLQACLLCKAERDAILNFQLY